VIGALARSDRTAALARLLAKIGKRPLEIWSGGDSNP